MTYQDRDMSVNPVVPVEDEVELAMPVESSSEPAPDAEGVEDAEDNA